MTTGERIRDLRTKKEISQKEFANMVNIDRSTLSAIENGRVHPCTEIILEFAEILGVSVAYILGEND